MSPTGFTAAIDSLSLPHHPLHTPYFFGFFYLSLVHIFSLLTSGLPRVSPNPSLLTSSCVFLAVPLASPRFHLYESWLNTKTLWLKLIQDNWRLLSTNNIPDTDIPSQTPHLHSDLSHISINLFIIWISTFCELISHPGWSLTIPWTLIHT